MAETRQLSVSPSFVLQDPQVVHVLLCQRQGTAPTVVSFDISLEAERVFNFLHNLPRSSRFQRAFRMSHLHRQLVSDGRWINVRHLE